MRNFIFVLLLLPGLSVAAPLTWTINNLTLSNGGTITGSFDYDAGTDVLSNINIVSTAYGDSFAITDANVDSADFCPPEPFCGIDTVEFVVYPTSRLVRDIGFYLDAPLTNSGGVVSINTAFDVRHDNLTGDHDEINLQYPTTATLSAVPVPAAVWLFGSALAGLGWLRRGTAV